MPGKPPYPSLIIFGILAANPSKPRIKMLGYSGIKVLAYLGNLSFLSLTPGATVIKLNLWNFVIS
jgi:hypothetical protein